MKRKELWELLGEVPADMIEEASIPRKGNRVLWLRRVLPLAAAVVLLTATAVAAGKYWVPRPREWRKTPSRWRCRWMPGTSPLR